MSHWRQQMVDGADFWISCHWLAFLSSLSQWQLIQKLVPSTICCHQYDIGIRRNFEKWKKSARRCQHHKIKKPNLKTFISPILKPSAGVVWTMWAPKIPVCWPRKASATLFYYSNPVIPWYGLVSSNKPNWISYMFSLWQPYEKSTIIQFQGWKSIN